MLANCFDFEMVWRDWDTRKRSLAQPNGGRPRLLDCLCRHGMSIVRAMRVRMLSSQWAVKVTRLQGCRQLLWVIMIGRSIRAMVRSMAVAMPTRHPVSMSFS